MIKSIIVVDDFYDNPHEKRSFALEQEYNVTGNYPGRRTISLLNDEAVDKLSNITKILVIV